MDEPLWRFFARYWSVFLAALCVGVMLGVVFDD